jgi:hypothetical protein
MEFCVSNPNLVPGALPAVVFLVTDIVLTLDILVNFPFKVETTFLHIFWKIITN